MEGLNKAQEGVFDQMVIEYESLLIMYRTARDTDEILNSEHFDQMSYDIDGYSGVLYDIREDNDLDYMREELGKLKAQVSMASKLVIALKGINYRFG